MPRLTQSEADRIMSLPLDEILHQRGYFYKKEKNSRNYLVMSNESGDTIVISRQSDGHYLYFNPNDERDRGNVFNFAKNRNLNYKDLINEQKGINLSQTEHKIGKVSPKDENQAINDKFAEFKPINTERNYLLQKRAISQATLENLDNIKEDSFKNVCVATYAVKDIKNETINLNTQLIIQCGFISYLKAPMKKDKDGNPLKKPLKQICYGSKGLEVIKDKSISKMNDVKHIILAESSIDTLSAFELKDFDKKSTLLCATNGQVTQAHKKVLEFLENNTNATLYLAFDRDEKGQNFTKLIQNSLKTMKCEVLKPILKDFNDDLTIMKQFDLKKTFTPNDIEEALRPYHKIIGEYIEKKDFLLPLPKIKMLQEARNAKDILLKLQPKLEEYIYPRFSSSQRAIKKLDEALAKEHSQNAAKI